MGDIDQRYQQDRHGFSKLTPVNRDAAGWRQSLAGEVPDAIVSRVFGPAAFAVITSGEIDGLSGLVTGSTYGVSGFGPIVQNGTPIVAKAVSTTNLLVSIQSYASSTSATSANANLSLLQAAVSQNTSDIAALTAADLLSEKIINKGAVNGYAPLVGGKIPASYITSDNLPIRRAWMGV